MKQYGSSMGPSQCYEAVKLHAENVYVREALDRL